MDVSALDLAKLSLSGASVAALWRYGGPVAKWVKSLRDSAVKSDATVLTATVAAKGAAVVEQIKQDGESHRTESTNTVSLTKLAIDAADSQKRFADGVVLMLRECEERSRVDTLRHQHELQAVIDRCGQLVTDVTARYEAILAGVRSDSDARDLATRGEVRAIIDTADSMNRTFQAQTLEFAEYRQRHPSDGKMAAVRPRRDPRSE